MLSVVLQYGLPVEETIRDRFGRLLRDRRFDLDLDLAAAPGRYRVNRSTDLEPPGDSNQSAGAVINVITYRMLNSMALCSTKCLTISILWGDEQFSGSEAFSSTMLTKMVRHLNGLKTIELKLNVGSRGVDQKVSESIIGTFCYTQPIFKSLQLNASLYGICNDRGIMPKLGGEQLRSLEILEIQRGTREDIIDNLEWDIGMILARSPNLQALQISAMRFSMENAIAYAGIKTLPKLKRLKLESMKNLQIFPAAGAIPSLVDLEVNDIKEYINMQDYI